MKKMKAMKVMAAATALTMAMGTTVMARENEVIEDLGENNSYSKELPVYGTYTEDPVGDGYVYAINLAWGAMDFVYNASPEWDPDAFQYTDDRSHWRTTADRVTEDMGITEDTELTPELEEEALEAMWEYSGIVVQNCSNDMLDVTLEFEGNEELTGVFSTQKVDFKVDGEGKYSPIYDGDVVKNDNITSYQLDSADRPIVENGEEKGAPTGGASILDIDGAPITESGNIGTLTITIKPYRAN